MSIVISTENSLSIRKTLKIDTILFVLWMGILMKIHMLKC